MISLINSQYQTIKTKNWNQNNYFKSNKKLKTFLNKNNNINKNNIFKIMKVMN